MNVFVSRAALRLGLGAALGLGIAGCAGSETVGPGGGGGNGGGAVQAEYDLALKKWQAVAPVHYRIVVRQTCECTAEFQRASRVTVRRTGDASVEMIEEVLDAATLQPTSAERREAAKSVDGLLVLISQLLALNPAESRITYDGTLGYPISVNVDPVVTISGDEFVYKVTSFETLP